MKITQKPLKINFTKGRTHKPIAIVIHLMDGSLSGTEAWFNNPKSQASTHYGVGKKGEIVQWVAEEDTAWANGRIDKPTWKLINARVSPNNYTISIEHEGRSGHIWTDAQYEADAFLVQKICEKWGIPVDADHIILHSEIFAKKPNCAGKGFSKERLLSMLAPQVKKNTLVKGDKSPSVYWVDNNSVRHAIKTWEYYLEYFGGGITTYAQKQVDALKEGKPFKT